VRYAVRFPYQERHHMKLQFRSNLSRDSRSLRDLPQFRDHENPSSKATPAKQNRTPHLSSQPPITHNGIRVESVRSYVCLSPFWKPFGLAIEKLCRHKKLGLTKLWNSYNKYLSVAARVVRRSLKDDKRLAAERRGEMELRFAKWNVSVLLDAGIASNGI